MPLTSKKTEELLTIALDAVCNDENDVTFVFIIPEYDKVTKIVQFHLRSNIKEEDMRELLKDFLNSSIVRLQ